MKESVQYGSLPIGPYSPAIRIDRWIYCSGQIPIDPTTGQIIKGGIKEQTAQCIYNLRSILRAVGVDLEQVVKITVYMTDLSQFDEMNKVYEQFFSQPYPARTTIQVAALPKGALIEIDAIAYIE